MGGAKCLCPRAGIGLSNVTASATSGSRTRITAADTRHLSEESPLAETEDQPRCDGLARKTTNHSKLPHPHAALIGRFHFPKSPSARLGPSVMCRTVSLSRRSGAVRKASHLPVAQRSHRVVRERNLYRDEPRPSVRRSLPIAPHLAMRRRSRAIRAAGCSRLSPRDEGKGTA